MEAIIPVSQTPDFAAVITLAEQLRQLRDEKADLETYLKEVKEDIAHVEASLVEAMTECDTQNFTHGGAQFILTSTTYASAVGGKKEDLHEALRANGYGDLITESVNAQTLSSTVRGLMEENKDALPNWLTGLVSTFDKSGISVRKATKKT
jgi:hypothetical protein